MSDRRGRLITLEGVEGVGKSTQLSRLVGIFEDAGIDVIVTREPGGTPAAEVVRSLMLEHGEESIPASAEVLLVFAARALHVANLIEPALTRGQWVVSDRFVDASRAYQGAGRGIPEATIETLASLALGDLRPDATLLLDAPVETGLARVGMRGGKDRIESEGIEFFRRVRDRYLELAAAEPERFWTLDASEPLEAVTEAVERVAHRIIDNFK